MEMLMYDFSHQVPIKHGNQFHLWHKSTLAHPSPTIVLPHYTELHELVCWHITPPFHTPSFCFWSWVLIFSHNLDWAWFDCVWSNPWKKMPLFFLTEFYLFVCFCFCQQRTIITLLLYEQKPSPDSWGGLCLGGFEMPHFYHQRVDIKQTEYFIFFTLRDFLSLN